MKQGLGSVRKKSILKILCFWYHVLIFMSKPNKRRHPLRWDAKTKKKGTKNDNKMVSEILTTSNKTKDDEQMHNTV